LSGIRIRVALRIPGGAGPYQSIRATMEQPPAGIGLDQYGRGCLGMPGGVVAIVGKGIGARDDVTW
jgi:hypothetical protein